MVYYKAYSWAALFPLHVNKLHQLLTETESHLHVDDTRVSTNMRMGKILKSF